MNAHTFKIGLAFSLLVISVNFAQAQHRAVIKTPKKTYVKTTKVVTTPRSKVRIVAALPKSTVVIKRQGINYHFNNGIYYRYDNGKYRSVIAPIGLVIRTLPQGFRRVSISGKNYFHFENTYYIASGSSYRVVEPPILFELPGQADLVVIDRQEYYTYNGLMYKIVTTPQGKGFRLVGDLYN